MAEAFVPVDAPPSVQSQAASTTLHADKRLQGMFDVYVNDANRKYLLDVGMMNYNQAAATRVHEESGSGRTRELGPRPTA